MVGWFNYNHMPVEGRTILLTGGSEGTGLCAARIFASEGANIILVSRSQVKLDEALKDIKAAAKSPETQRFHAIPADVSTPNYAEAVIDDATAWNNGQPPEIVWCLAGLSTPMLLTDDGALEAARYNMDVNYFGSAEMARAIMRAWLLPSESKQRENQGQSRPPAKHLIFTGSVLSLFSLAGHGTYAPSKFALRALADSLALEVLLYPDVPIKIHLLLPNSILTEGLTRENSTKPEITLKLEGADKPQPAEEVARLSIAGIRKGRYFVPSSFMGEMIRLGAMNSPRNNWFIDTLGGFVFTIVWGFVLWGMRTDVVSWANQKKKEKK